MKYIRTENELRESINDYGDKYPIADTIEELCDEFVIVGTNWQQIIDLESARYNLKRPKELKVYGAIWTDKGLNYVAKMNDKGEFELL